MRERESDELEEWTGVNVVTDCSFGDNGKGKAVDLMAERADVVVRYNGGSNAGHTVKNEKGEFILHLMPSGIFNPKTISVIGDTVVVDPIALAGEIKCLQDKNLPVNLLVSKKSHLVMPWQIARDGLQEKARGGDKIGTTGRGIGPTYGDRSERVGLRVGDLLSPDFESKFDKELIWQQKLVNLMAEGDGPVLDRDKILANLYEAREIIGPMITNVLPVITKNFESGKNILGEGAQGALLDLDRGTYPNVTSSHPGINGFHSATNIPPQYVDRVIAVTKAYTTRVGSGVLPTELFDETGERIREIGNEYGATTLRPRRVGWLDIPIIRYGLNTVGADSLALMKIDVFDGFETVKICYAYEIDGKCYATIPDADEDLLKRAKPIYDILPGWDKETTGCRQFRNLPKNARHFVEKVQDYIDMPIELVSVGPSREASIFL